MHVTLLSLDTLVSTYNDRSAKEMFGNFPAHTLGKEKTVTEGAAGMDVARYTGRESEPQAPPGPGNPILLGPLSQKKSLSEAAHSPSSRQFV